MITMFSNAKVYNQEGSEIYEDASVLLGLFEKVYAQKTHLLVSSSKNASADKNKPSKEDIAAIFDAIQHDQGRTLQHIVARLKRDGITMDFLTDNTLFVDRFKWGPLHACAFMGRERLIRVLLSDGDASVDFRDGWFGSSALGWAAYANQYKIAEMLVDEFKANIEHRNKNGMIPIDLVPADVENMPLWTELLTPVKGGKKILSKVVKDQMKSVIDYLLEKKEPSTKRKYSDMFLVLPDKKLYPDYYAVIQKPMCFQLIEKNIYKNAYSSWEEFDKDVLEIYKNAMYYNQEGSIIYEDAAVLKKETELLIAARYDNQLQAALRGQYKLPTLKLKLSTASLTDQKTVATAEPAKEETKKQSSEEVESAVSIAKLTKEEEVEAEENRKIKKRKKEEALKEAAARKEARRTMPPGLFYAPPASQKASEPFDRRRTIAAQLPQFPPSNNVPHPHAGMPNFQDQSNMYGITQRHSMPLDYSGYAGMPAAPIVPVAPISTDSEPIIKEIKLKSADNKYECVFTPENGMYSVFVPLPKGLRSVCVESFLEDKSGVKSVAFNRRKIVPFVPQFTDQEDTTKTEQDDTKVKYMVDLKDGVNTMEFTCTVKVRDEASNMVEARQLYRIALLRASG